MRFGLLNWGQIPIVWLKFVLGFNWDLTPINFSRGNSG